MRRVIIMAMLCLLAGNTGFDAEQLEQEQHRDDRMWQVMRQVLVYFGCSNKVAVLDVAWQKTQTPAQRATEWRTNAVISASIPSATAEAVAARCAAARNVPFADLFRQLCAEELAPADLFNGLLLWTRDGGQPTLQGRHDLALHFIYAASYECALGLGRTVALAKEQFDQAQGKPFDLDDMAASFAGAAWVRQAKTDSRWMSQWAKGQKSLDKNLPRFQYGTGPHTNDTLTRIDREIAAALGI